MIQGPPPNLAMMHPHAQLMGALPMPPPGVAPTAPPPGLMLGAPGPNILSMMAGGGLLAPPPGHPLAGPPPRFGPGQQPGVFNPNDPFALFNPLVAAAAAANKMSLGKMPSNPYGFNPAVTNDIDEDDMEKLSVNDDAAYDLDDEDENGVDDDEAQYISSSAAHNERQRGGKSSRHHQKRPPNQRQQTYDENYDLEDMDYNLDEIISDRGNKSKQRRSSNRSSSRSRRRRHHRRSSDEDNEENGANDENDDDDDESSHHRRGKSSRHRRKKHQEPEQDLESIKSMLQGLLEMHINNLEEGEDEDLRATLESLLEQVNTDDGSLTYEDCANIHKTVKSLYSQNDEEEEEEIEERVNIF